MRISSIYCVSILVGLTFLFSAPIQDGSISYDVIKTFPDSATYLDLSSARPPIATVFFSNVTNNITRFVLLSMFSICAWAWLGWILLGLPGIIYMLALSVSVPIAMWNYALLSESLTLSLGILMCATTIVLGRKFTWIRLISWTLCSGIFISTRIENFILMQLLGVFLLAWKSHRIWIAPVCVTYFGVALLYGFVYDTQNWQARMTNIVLMRHVESPTLPHEPALATYRNHAHAYYDQTFRDATPRFQNWLQTSSRSEYIRWLLTWPAQWDFLTHVNEVIGSCINEYYLNKEIFQSISPILTPFYYWVAMPFQVWVYIFAIPFLAVIWSAHVRFIYVFTIALMIGVYCLAFLGYHADAAEVDRHVVLASALYRVVPLAALACMWEAYVYREG